MANTPKNTKKSDTPDIPGPADMPDPAQTENRIENSTHFGFKTVPLQEKQQRVRSVFDSVASKYDLMNDLMSFGIHRLWKRFLVEYTAVRPGDQVLDIAGGTGDISQLLLKSVGKLGQVTLLDINHAMLEVGRDRLIDKGHTAGINYVQANAEKLPFPDNHFNAITIAFGLRNVTHKEIALSEMTRVIQPGGAVYVLEFSKPTSKTINKLYDKYSFKLLPKIGRWITGDEDSYQYLAESIRMHPEQNKLRDMMSAAGLEQADYVNLNQGIVAIHRGFKPLNSPDNINSLEN